MIKLQRIGEGDPLDFEVVVREGKGETRHHVTMSEVKSKQLTAGKHTSERCLDAAFRFLGLRPDSRRFASRWRWQHARKPSVVRRVAAKYGEHAIASEPREITGSSCSNSGK